MVTLLNLARGDGDLADRIGYRAPGSGQKQSRHAIEEKKRQEAATKFALDQARKALDEHIQRLREQIAESDRKVGDRQRQLALQKQSLIRPRLGCARRLRAALRQWLRATPPGNCKRPYQGG